MEELNHIESIFAAVAGGKLLAEACADQGLPVFAFWNRLYGDDALRARWPDIRAEMVRVRGADPKLENLRQNSRRLNAPAHACRLAIRARFEDILARIRDGHPVARCCEDLHFKKHHLLQVVNSDLALRGRYLTARCQGAPLRAKFTRRKRRPVTAKSGRRRYIEDILVLLQSGMTLSAACRSRPKFPTVKQFMWWVSQDPDLKRRYQAASRHLQAPSLADDVLTAVIADFAAGTLLKSACQARGILVPAFQHRVLDHPNWRSRWFAAKAQRQRARNLVQLDAKIAAPALVRDRALGYEVLRRIREVLPGWLDADAKQEVLSEMALALLEGKLALRNISSESAVEFARSFNRENSPYRFVSVDKSLSNDSNLSLLDTLSNDR